MISANKKLITIFLLSLSLSACEQDNIPDRSTAHGRGMFYAKSVRESAHRDYLNCYALAPEEKTKCTEYLAQKHLNHLSVRQEATDPEFIKGFQFESEKLGFQYFLESENLPCGGIKNGPEFDVEKQAYLVQCKHNRGYFMQFNYQSRSWGMKR